MNICANPKCLKETSNNKFCSRSCAASVNNTIKPKRVSKRKCTRCDNITVSYRHRLCTIHREQHFNRSTIDHTLESYWNRESVKRHPRSARSANIRSLAQTHFKDLRAKPCANCGYDKHVELCHIKAISSFSDTDKIRDVNSYENLIQLCPNCHWEFDHTMTDEYKNTLIQSR